MIGKNSETKHYASIDISYLRLFNNKDESYKYIGTFILAAVKLAWLLGLSMLAFFALGFLLEKNRKETPA